MGMISCDRNLSRAWDWCITKGQQCQYKDPNKDRPLKDGDWVLTPPERLAIETYIIIKEEEVESCQKKD
jgi:hypothetical protein